MYIYIALVWTSDWRPYWPRLQWRSRNIADGAKVWEAEDVD